MTDPDLSGALTLNSPEACLAHYRAWADSYDSGFAEGMDYLLPAHVAAAFLAAGGGSPVLDVGAGTGLLAERLREMGQAGPALMAVVLSFDLSWLSPFPARSLPYRSICGFGRPKALIGLWLPCNPLGRLRPCN